MLRAGGPRLLALLIALVTSAGVVGCTDDGEVADPVVAPPTGWDVSVYFTAVERFHDGPPKRVTGCVVAGCPAQRDHIGYYPSDFVDAVEFSGSGRLETGRYAGRFLNWSEKSGFWVDDFPRDSHGGVLVPFTSAAADPAVLAPGTVFRLVACGTTTDGSPVPTAVCDQLSSQRWTVADEITPGVAGDRQVDLYVGDETLTTFTNGVVPTTFVGAEVTVDNATGAPSNPFDPTDPGSGVPPGPQIPPVLPGSPGPSGSTTTSPAGGPLGTAPATTTTSRPATRPTLGPR